MDELKRRILNDAIAAKEDIVQVDMFLNHNLDIPLLEDMGAALAKRFRGAGITKVLTAETSGIALACFTAQAMGTGAVYAKRFHTGYTDSKVYFSDIHSFSMDKTYTLSVSQKYIAPNDVILIVDDILASGQAVLGLLEIAAKAGAEVAGIGVAIEKATREGGKILRQMGFQVEALAVIQSVQNGKILLK
ncbi:MAG: xanthine phosphoribosyltransferase [Oscillospiraceae bacterium]|nr:xanthine phosphoribosyltransferase [Oscillospiraceae bacterium]